MSPGRRSRTVLTLGTAQILAWGSSYYLPAVLAAPMARELGLAPSAVFAAFSAALVVAAIVGPWAGQAIDRHGGRPVLAASSLVFAAGLATLALAHGLAGMIAGWLILGAAMGAGLYEGAFAAAVRLFGHEARGAVTGITLLGGFASTVAWPLSAALDAQDGWRFACLAWAALHVLVGLPLNTSLPGIARQRGTHDASADTRNPVRLAAPEPAAAAGPALATLALVFAAGWFIGTAMAAHLPRVLQAGGVPLREAVLVGALIGPAQVAARLLDFGLLRRWHPLVPARIASLLHPLGALGFMAFGARVAAPFGVLHGAGMGILTIAKGTLPLALFGASGYGRLQGLLTIPTRFAQALAPWLFGLCLDRWGVGALWLTAVVGVLALAALLALRPRQNARMSPVTIFHNPACGTSRNVLALIRHAGIEPTIVEYLKTPLSREALRELFAATGEPVRALLRSKEKVFAELGLDDPSLDDERLLEAVERHPILMNRPVVSTPLGTKLCRPASESVLEILPVGPLPPFTKEDGEVVVDSGVRRTPKT